MSTVALDQLRDQIDFRPNEDLRTKPVTSVITARSFSDIETAPSGAVVVVEATLHRDLRTYRFDIALGATDTGVAAIVTTPGTTFEPTPTSLRLAGDRGIALGVLRPDQDAVSLAVRLRDLTRGDDATEVAAFENVCDLVERCTSSDDIDELLTAVSRQLGTNITLSGAVVDGLDVPIRVQGIIRHHLNVEDRSPSPLLTAATSHLARKVEALVQADYEANELHDATRAELLNEILLNDEATSSNATGRLRLAEFPIDGHHYAIRVDCHDPLPNVTSVKAIYHCQQRLGEIMLHSLRRTKGHWTKAGTANSILLIWSRPTAHTDLLAAEVERMTTEAIADAEKVFPELRIHIGLGTAHLGVAGIRSSVTEATTAVRAARERDLVNQPHQFDRLGLSRALVRWAEIDGVRPVINEIISPLLDQTPRRAREALTTLRAYLDSGRNISTTAEALHLHRNTVRYRLDRIIALLPVDLDDPDERLLLELSCRIAASEHL